MDVFIAEKKKDLRWKIQALLALSICLKTENSGFEIWGKSKSGPSKYKRYSLYEGIRENIIKFASICTVVQPVDMNARVP